MTVHDAETRAASVAAAVAGTSWTLLAAESIARPQPRIYRTVAWYVPWLATTVAVDRLHRMQSENSDRTETLGHRLNLVGVPLIAIGNALSVRPGGGPYAAAAALTWTAGLVLFGIGTARTGVSSRWIGPAIALSQPLTVVAAVAMSRRVPLSPVGSYSGALAHGAVWLSIARSLRRA